MVVAQPEISGYHSARRVRRIVCDRWTSDGLSEKFLSSCR